MKVIKFTFIIIALLSSSYCVFGQKIPGSQYFYLSNGITFFPLGASGVSHYLTMDSNFFNPAGYADIRRITADLSLGGLGTENFLINARGSFPTNYGIVTGNVTALTFPGGLTAGDVVQLRGTFSKFISEEWLFGAGINLGYGKGPESDVLASFDIGTIYRKYIDGTGFGIFDYSVGGVLKNLGKNISYSGYDSFPFLGMDIGGRVEFIRKGIYKSRLSSHLAIPLNPPGAFFGIGLENIFLDMVNLKLGLNLGIENIKPLSLGFDLTFPLEDTDVQFSYSMLPVEYGGTTHYSHNAGVSVAFGSYDRKAPEVSLSVETPYFSPNHDGVNDRARFSINIDDNTMVFGWKLEITDEDGVPVKSYVAQDVRKIRYMTVGKYLKRIFAKKEEVEIPKVIEWSGEDAEGNLVEDGTYYYTLSAWDENNNKTVTPREPLVVDTVVPLVEVKTDMHLFSPNNDGAIDTLPVSIQSANIMPEDEVVLKITDRDDNSVWEKRFRGEVPEKFVWDGKNSSGVVVNEGVYNISISVSDRAGNKSSSRVEGIVVKTEYEKVSVSPSFRVFSPNGDGYYDINEIKLFSSSKEGLINWGLQILDKDNQVVREYTGKKDFPDIISFDGKDSDGKVLPDGLYSVKFSLFYESGNHPEAYFKFIRIDNTPPQISVSVNITAFSPNGDGIKDTITFLHEIKADKGDTFRAKIINTAGGSFKTFDFGTNPPGALVWNGMGDGGVQPVEGTYTYTITGEDEVANSTSRSVGPIKLVTGFEQISVEPSEYIFSPNEDGVKDTVTFKLNTTTRQGILEWKLDITNTTGEVIKSFNYQNMGLDLPEEVKWEGKTEDGTQATDGVYTVSFSILYDTGNNPVSKPKEVIVDTRSPSIEVIVKDLYISPNNDGVKETLTIYQNIRGEAGDKYTAQIVDSSGNPVKEFLWEYTPPSEIVWDGRDSEGNPLKEETYSYIITGKDRAGNTTQQKVTGMVLVTTYEKVSVVVSNTGISPNGDGFMDAVDFVPSISSEKDLQKWYLDLYNRQAQVVRTIEGTGIPPAVITWEGKDNQGKLVPDGEYTYLFGLIYKSGNHPTSGTGKVIVDTTPPQYNFVVSPELFSPDDDGEADTLYLNLEVLDRNDVAGWEVVIYRKWNGKVDRSVPFKKFSGKGNFKGMIKWDGYSDPVPMPAAIAAPDPKTYRKVDGKWAVLVDSAANYVAELSAADTLGNAIEASRNFSTDILVIPTPYGLKIMINSIQFEFDKAELLPQSFPILERLIEIIEKFPHYKINIVGHTDSIGTDEYNQKLSERRAFAVYKYLVEHDVDKDRLTIEGRGETQPIDDNSTEMGRARNRRVEFFLTKKSS